MFSVFCASHSRLHWPVALRWRASLSSSICSRSFFQRRYSALSRPVMDMVMSTEPFGPGLRLYRDRVGHKIVKFEVREKNSGGIRSRGTSQWFINTPGAGLNPLNLDLNPLLKNITYSPLFLQFSSCLYVVEVQPSPVSYMSPTAFLSVCVWCWAWTPRVVQEVTDRFVSIRLRRTRILM